MEFERMVYPIVLAALEKCPPELADFINRACKGDSVLRTEVLNRLRAIDQVVENLNMIRELGEGEP